MNRWPEGQEETQWCASPSAELLGFLSKYRRVSHLQTWQPSMLYLTTYYKANKPGRAFCIVSVIILISAIPLDKSNVLLT